MKLFTTRPSTSQTYTSSARRNSPERGVDTCFLPPPETHQNVVLMVQINDWFFADKRFLDEIRAFAIEVAPIIPAGEDVTVEMICGPENWASWSKYRRILAGMCMRYLVRKKLVPFRKPGKPCQSPKVYQSLKGA
jgi:hypothetical protein